MAENKPTPKHTDNAFFWSNVGSTACYYTKNLSEGSIVGIKLKKKKKPTNQPKHPDKD